MIGPITLNQLAAAVIVLLGLACAVLAHKLIRANRRIKRQRTEITRLRGPARKESSDG